MKTQDEFPFDTTILGLNDVYQTVGNDSYYINSKNIITTDKLLTMYKKYILIYNPNGTGVVMTDVIFLDAYCFEGVIYLIVQDIDSQVTDTIGLDIECPENPCNWILIDINFFIDEIRTDSIKSYCGNCDDTNDKYTTDVNPKQRKNSDLLDFDY